ncbi:MAG: oligoendopeptidase F [Candidatus Hydrogenedentes bacterium]|nr:oligoendopeptidase F [Candidatus Hydrogenedentota bacterium]
MTRKNTQPLRKDVKNSDTWNLTLMFKNIKAWEQAYRKLEKDLAGFDRFKGKLGRSAKNIQQCFTFNDEYGQLLEKVSVYAQLKYCEDITNPVSQGIVARTTHLAMHAGERSSYIAPEIQAIPQKKMAIFLKDPVLSSHCFLLKKLLRYRPHILSSNEERLLAMQGEVAGTSSRIFDQLTDADMTFGTVKDETGEEVEVTQISLRRLLESPRRTVRKQAFQKYYATMESHRNSMAAMLNGSVLQDVYYARIRNYPSALEAALFDDKVPGAVYSSLITTVKDALPTLYRYFELRKRALRVKDLHIYDNYVPITKTKPVNIPYDEAVVMICDAMAPLGDEYVNVMRKGLTSGRWVDRYENKNKESGAFSYGCYDCQPYILMNYQPQVLDSVFTLAHEAGHSMHSWFSMNNQPYQYANYPIILAEVASTVNEQLLSHYLLERAATKSERILLLNKKIDEIRFTIIRQTMFAEFEKEIHTIAEAGAPLTLETFRNIYRELLEVYFGPDFCIDNALELEGLRIPHFYRAFYVYKYATGLSSAIALASRIVEGNTRQQSNYLKFLSSGSSLYPIATLKRAGIDLTGPEPVVEAMNTFKRLVGELEALL